MNEKTLMDYPEFADLVAHVKARPKMAEIMHRRGLTEADLDRYRRLKRDDMAEVSQRDLDNMVALGFASDSRCGEFPLGWSAEKCEKCGQYYLPTYIEYLDEHNQYQTKKLRHIPCFPGDGDCNGRDLASYRLVEAGIPDRLKTKRLSNFVANTPARKAALQSVKDLVEGRITCLLILGATQTGKTHLGAAFMTELMNRRKDVTYRSELQIKSELKKASGFSSKASTDDVRAKYESIDNLVIDKVNQDEAPDEAEKHFCDILLERLDSETTRTLILSTLTPDRFRARFSESIRNRISSYGTSVNLADEQYKPEETTW